MLFSSASILLSILLVMVWHSLAYPMYEPRPREPQDLQELLMWSQAQPPQPQFQPLPARPEYEPAAYGYPDYGDYAEPRPAYTELDILREQLARSQPPFNKRLLPYEAIGTNWDDAGEPPVPNAATWYDAEVPVAVVQPNPAVMNANAAGLEALTEALLQVLTQQMDQDRNSQMSLAGFDAISEEEQDPIVEELKQTAVKKSVMASSPAKTESPTAESITATPSSHTSEEMSTTQKSETNEHGQKEVPLLRPPKPGKKPFFPVRLPSKAVILDSGSSNNRNNIKRTVKKVMKPRSAFRHQTSSVVTNEEDLTKELNSLKKREQ